MIWLSYCSEFRDYFDMVAMILWIQRYHHDMVVILQRVQRLLWYGCYDTKNSKISSWYGYHTATSSEITLICLLWYYEFKNIIMIWLSYCSEFRDYFDMVVMIPQTQRLLWSGWYAQKDYCVMIQWTQKDHSEMIAVTPHPSDYFDMVVILQRVQRESPIWLL